MVAAWSRLNDDRRPRRTPPSGVAANASARHPPANASPSSPRAVAFARWLRAATINLPSRRRGCRRACRAGHHRRPRRRRG
jgi:hypothetical protein